MKYYFVVNPVAGAGSAEETIRTAVEALPQKGDCFVYVTKSETDAEDFVRSTCAEHKGEKMRFIACGGDGTINGVFSGAVGAENVSVTCYPCGSGNDFVKCFGGAETFTDIASYTTTGIVPLVRAPPFLAVQHIVVSPVFREK